MGRGIAEPGTGTREHSTTVGIHRPVMDESLCGLVLLPPVLYGTCMAVLPAIQLEHLKLDVYVRGISLAISGIGVLHLPTSYTLGVILD